jgi:two-component system response regulator DevR
MFLGQRCPLLGSEVLFGPGKDHPSLVSRHRQPGPSGGCHLGSRPIGHHGVVPIRVFVLDDHELVRRGIRDLLANEDDLEVVGEAASAQEALTRIPGARPDVALLDVRLGGGPEASNGIEVCRDIRSAHPHVACLMLTSFSDDEALFASIMAGAAGYLLKQVHGNDLVGGIRQVAAGESLLDPAVTARVLDRLRNPPIDTDPLEDLTPQEKRILTLISDGKTNRQIGEEMYLAEKTVKNYVSRLLAKLGMARRSEAAAYAARLAERHRGDN